MSAVPARTVFVGLDACDVAVAREFVATGDMPMLAQLLDTAAVQPTLGPYGWLVGGNWVTMLTGTTATRHQFLCPGQVRGGTYEPRWAGPVHAPAVWNAVSDAGQRVAVLDAPHFQVPASLNGVQLQEWGAHDRHAGPQSYPREFLDEINATYGPHPVGTYTTPYPHFAPCDYSHREGDHRTLDENRALLADIFEGLRRKTSLSIDLLRRGEWDFFLTVFGESHCAGHQFWKHHDPTHRWHDPVETRALGNDPMRQVYAALDASLGRVLDAAGTDATVYVMLSHGMRPHYDGTCLLDPVLWRLDEYVSGLDDRGSFSRVIDRGANALPSRVRRRAIVSVFDARRRLVNRAGPIGTDGRPVEIPQWLGQRRWWMQPNDSVYGSVRVNLEGREPNGRVIARHKRAVESWLAERLLELVNVDTGEPVVLAVTHTDDVYERVPGDPMGDLIVEWNRAEPIDTVWSPATGVVTAPYTEWRTGDHQREGLLLARGPGIRPGVRAGSISVIDIGPTLAASLGVEMPGVDGIARADLLPAEAAGAVRPSTVLRRPLLGDASVATPAPRRYDRGAYDVPLDRWNELFSVGLSRTVHANRVLIEEGRQQLGIVARRTGDLERLAAIAQVSAWLRHVEVPESLLISVVMPTRNRASVVERAIESVRRQSYGNWELLVVDDASTDETWTRLEKLAADEPRLRPLRLETHERSSVARNRALDAATGEVLTYLDDDNRFDPDWLRAVAWAFTEYPETRVAYGARVIDDEVRHRGLDGRSMPFVQFLAWDRDAMLERCLVDQNVIAHRASPARFSETFEHFSDWDLMLQLTDDCDPLELPLIATHYYSDAAGRLSQHYRTTTDEYAAAELVRERARARRGAR